MITPFRKFLKQITNWTKQGNLALLWLGSLTLTTVWMALSRNQRLLDTACKDHWGITQLKLRSNHLHRTFELHCTTNFCCKEALNRPRLPFLPLLLFSSYWLIREKKREKFLISARRYSIFHLSWENVWLWLWVTTGVKTGLTDCCIRTMAVKTPFLTNFLMKIFHHLKLKSHSMA